jgi:hypothetical protein
LVTVVPVTSMTGLLHASELTPSQVLCARICVSTSGVVLLFGSSVGTPIDAL